MGTIGNLVVNITGNTSGLQKSISKAQGLVHGFGGKVQTLGKVAMGGLPLAAGGLLTLGVASAKLGTQFVSMGADANETASLLENSLGGSVNSLNDRLRTFASDANRSFYELQAGSSTFVAMTRAMGATQGQAADLSVSFTEMATDLGSFFNVSTDNALQDLQGALAGSSETMQKYGIDVRETTLKQMALDQGIIKSAKETIPRLARAQLIQQAIMEQASDAMGDAIRTSDSWQNTLRGLQGRLRDTGTALGQKLIPALRPFLGIVGDLAAWGLPWLSDVLSKSVIPYIQTAGEVTAAFVNNLREGMSPLNAFIEAIWDLAPPGVLDFLVSLRDKILPGLSTWFTKNVQPIIDMVTQFVSWKDVLIALAIAIGSVVLPALWGIVAAAAPVIAVGVALVGAIALVRNAWEKDWGGIRTAVLNAWRVIQGWADWFMTTALPQILVFADTIRGLWQAFREGGIQGFIEKLGPLMASLGPILLEAWNTYVAPVVLGWKDRIFDWAVQAYINAPTYLGNLVTAITTFLMGIWETYIAPIVLPWKDRIFDWAVQAYANIPTYLNDLITGITTFLTDDGAIAIREGAQEWATTIWEWVNTAIDQVGAIMGGLLIAIAAWAMSDEAQTNLNEAGIAIGQWVADGVAFLFENQAVIVGVLTKLAAGLLIGVAAIMGILIVTGGQIVAGILSGILKKLGVNLKPATFNELSGILGGIGSNIVIIAQHVGSSIVSGIVRGIQNGAGAIAGAAQAAAMSAFNAAKSALGISSPSQKFIELGKSSRQGWEKGFEDDGGLGKSVNRQVGGLLGRLGGGLSLAGGGGRGVTVQVTYSPVISTADSIEVETKLVPTVIRGLRKAGVPVG